MKNYRFGVAPDHPEVKNVINTFTKTAQNPRVRFLGNLALGTDFTVQELRERYHAVLLTYGADKDRNLNIPNETTDNVLSAREFVAWYNGLPGYQNFNPDLSGKSVTIIGQGNVAVDVARILLSPIDLLAKTDITENSLEILRKSKVEKVYLVGRRGPLQAAFTIKELREMLKLPNCSTTWRADDFDGIEEKVPELARPRKRITELMLKSLKTDLEDSKTNKQFIPLFFRSPKSILGDKSIELTINELSGIKAIPTKKQEILETDLILRSIGYKSVNLDKDLFFDDKNGLVHNISGRVLKKTLTGSDNTIDDIEDKFENGLYVSGWLGTGPTGVILTTMNNSFGVADGICKDFDSLLINVRESKPGIDLNGKRVVTWDKWEKIDQSEQEAGAKIGKPREKIVDVENMLKVAGV